MGRSKKFNDHPFPYHHELELEISTLTNLGLGLGRVRLDSTDQAGGPALRSPAERGEGWVVMVPFTLPGEKVRARVYRNHKNYSEADLLEVLTPSPHRVAPRCELFGRCGGCQYQHLAYAEQLEWKRRQVEELLRHMAGVEFPVAPTVPSPREFGYRSKITPHFQAGRANPPDEPRLVGTTRPTNPIGFLRQGSRFDIVDVPQCPIATPEINAKLTEVRTEVRGRMERGEYTRGATLLFRHAHEGIVTDFDAVIHEVIPQAATHSETCHLLGDKSGTPEGKCHLIGDKRPSAPLRLHFLARDFFQNNPFILPAFTDYVRKQAAGTSARFLVDAYCGSGLFALSCAPSFEKVSGVEISETSVKFATENAAANGIGNATFRAGDAAQIFAGLDFPPADTVVVIDPPRKGCDESFLQQLFAYGPRAVVYVSCDLATQMRDLKHFLAGHVSGPASPEPGRRVPYALKSVQPFDLFPQTRHLECVMTLARG